MKKTLFWSIALIVLLTSCAGNIGMKWNKGKVNVDGSCNIAIEFDKQKIDYAPQFTVMYSDVDPKPKMRPAGIPDVLYNAVTWVSQNGEAKKVERTADQTGDGFDDAILQGSADSRTFDLFNVGENIEVLPVGATQNGEAKKVERTADQTGDGFDDAILQGSADSRTFDLFNVGENIEVLPVGATQNGDAVIFSYPEHEKFTLKAVLTIDPHSNYPMLEYTLTPKTEGYFSVGFTGYKGADMASVKEIWQPMIWQEKRFPDRSYMTLAFRCPVPSTFVTGENCTYGVVAHPSEFPFDPLPTPANSRFGIAVRTADSLAAPMLFAPVLGGVESHMKPENAFSFKALLFMSEGTTTDALQKCAEDIYGFKDYRTNAIGTLNKTIENIIEYTLSDYSWFIDSEKGCAYSTDVPGAVKNVSSLNPIEIAIINDNPEIYKKRAYPIIEYMLSREKFLFTADSMQKIQFPSRRLNGPTAPISELTTMYNIYGHENPFLLDMAQKEYKGSRVRNLDVVEVGETWKTSLQLYKATGEQEYLAKAIAGADEYLASRVNTPATDFTDPNSGGFFFWTGFTPKWIDLLEMYEVTKDKKYLDAAHKGARQYTQFIWYSPAIPDADIVVNPDGKTPHYDYLKQKGHSQMDAERETVPAWRLSEIGLTPESSATSTGHRGIFMTNYAAWMLRIAYYTGDEFLAKTAKDAVIGRYTNFPGYHINTARTTIYEKEDYPLRGHKELGVNSFHYNHIMPHATLLYDYLITDMLYRSKGKITFPDEYIEAYAYLQSKLYGHKQGEFYGEKAWLWMPSGLAVSSDVELNYVAARGEGAVYLAFSNQSGKEVVSQITLDTQRLGIGKSTECQVAVVSVDGKATNITDGVFTVTVPANGLCAVKISGVNPNPVVQQHILTNTGRWKKDFAASSDDMVQSMVLKFGDDICNIYTYLKIEDVEYASASIDVNGVKMTDKVYPYEFTVPAGESKDFTVTVSAKRKNGSVKTWETLKLER